MSNIQLTVDELNKLKPAEIIRYEAVRSRFIQIYNALWGNGTGVQAYEREAFYFNANLRDNELARKTTNFSIFTAFIDLAVCGLSLEPGTRALCYLQPRNYKVGVDSGNRNVYESRLVLTISGYGELVLRARAGQIRHADNPVLVYEEDTFSFSDIDGRKRVSYTCNLPHRSNHIVAAYLRITRPDGTTDYSVMLEEDWLRLKDYSAKNGRKANDLYSSNGGSIDSGFLCAKLIKHAFKTYPKVRIGKAELESQQPDPTEDDVEAFCNVDGVPAQQPKEPEPQPFGNQPDMSAGVVITDNDDDAF